MLSLFPSSLRSERLGAPNDERPPYGPSPFEVRAHRHLRSTRDQLRAKHVRVTDEVDRTSFHAALHAVVSRTQMELSPLRRDVAMTACERGDVVLAVLQMQALVRRRLMA